jgi:hypothetical protein
MKNRMFPVFFTLAMAGWILTAASKPIWAAVANNPKQSYSLKNKFGTSLTINADDGSYTVEQTTAHAAGAALAPGQQQSWLGRGLISVYAGRRWFRSSDDRFLHLPGNDHAEGRLVLSGARRGSATDSLGNYDFVELSWTVPGEGIPIITTFHLYKEKPYLVFVQRFPKGFKNYANGDWTVPSVDFPHFISPDWGIPQNLYSWTSGGMWNHRFGYGDAFSIQGTVDPLVISDPGYATLILSSFGNYLVATQQSRVLAMENTISRGSIACGIEGLVQEIPPGFEHQHIMVVGQGIHNTFQEWGRALLKKAGKRIVSKYQDDTLKYPVYMDDAGAYYYEHDFKESGYKTYADIILAIEREAKEHDLRIGAYHVLDDPQQLTRSEGLFEPRSDLFPEGLAKFHERLGKPLELYTLWLRSNSPYRKKYAFFDVGTENPPRMGHMGMGDVFYTPEYWRFTADKLASWGAILLQIDFLSDYEGNPVTMSSVDRMDAYFKNMAKALQEKGIDIQYGMVLPRNIMESTENPLMVSLQASEDHHVPMTEPHPQPDNPDNNDPFFWKHMIFTSAFYGAVSIWPSRDNIQTVADPNAFEDTLIANLLGGSIQLGHRIGECNFDLLRHTYSEGDGLVLKPDRPIAPIDRCYQSGCALGYTQSDNSGQRWYYVLSLPSAGYTPHFTPSDLGGQGQFAVYNWDTGTVCLRHADWTVALVPEAKHEYFIVAPLFSNGITILGDLSKFVTMADKRIDFVRETEGSLRVGVIANAKHNPIISGYSVARPSKVECGGVQLEAVSSLDRLKAARAGWFWDYQTKLWHAKVDFAGATDMETRVFSIQ